MMRKTTGLTLYQGGSQILHDIDFQAKKGEVTCVMGTNGVGKTSLLRAMAGTYLRSGGEVALRKPRPSSSRKSEFTRDTELG